jgi:translation initiation factor 1
MSRSKRKLEKGEGWSLVRACPDCGRPTTECVCGAQETAGAVRAVVRLRLERRRGKAVTVFEAEWVDPDALRDAVRELKARCGAGGTVKGSTAEIQGDAREAARELLRARGIEVRG